MLGSPRAFRDDYLTFVYGKEVVGERRNINNTSPPKGKKSIRICLKFIQNDCLVQIMNLQDKLYIYDNLKKLIHF